MRRTPPRLTRRRPTHRTAVARAPPRSRSRRRDRTTGTNTNCRQSYRLPWRTVFPPCGSSTQPLWWPAQWRHRNPAWAGGSPCSPLTVSLALGINNRPATLRVITCSTMARIGACKPAGRSPTASGRSTTTIIWGLPATRPFRPRTTRRTAPGPAIFRSPRRICPASRPTSFRRRRNRVGFWRDRFLRFQRATVVRPDGLRCCH